MQEPWLSIVGGGLIAAVATIAFNAWWDLKKQKSSEDWEFRRYEANLIHFSTTGLMEAFFAARMEMFYLTSTLASLLASLNQLAERAEPIVRQQSGPALTVSELEERKRQLLQPFETFNQQQVTLRWNQYEQKVKELHAKAEVNLITLKALVESRLYEDLAALIHRLAAPFEWNLGGGIEKLRLLDEATPEMLRFREDLMAALEAKLGRKPKQWSAFRRPILRPQRKCTIEELLAKYKEMRIEV